MTATGHAVIGTVIASQIGDPVLAIPIALISHLAADLFPHWDPGTNRHQKSKERFLTEGFIDVVASLIITLLLVIFIFPQTDLIYAYMVVFFAQFFDWATAPYLFFKIEKPGIFKNFYNFQKNYFDNKLDKPWGIIGQVAVVTFLVLFFKFV